MISGADASSLDYAPSMNIIGGSQTPKSRINDDPVRLLATRRLRQQDQLPLVWRRAERARRRTVGADGWAMPEADFFFDIGAMVATVLFNRTAVGFRQHRDSLQDQSADRPL